MSAWIGFWAGAGPFYRVVGADINRVLAWEPPRDFSTAELARSGKAAVRRVGAIPSDLVNFAQIARTGFLMSGGGTNIVVPLRENADAGLAEAKDLQKKQYASAAYQERLAEQFRLAGKEPPAVTVPDPDVPAATPPAQTYRAVPITRTDHIKAAATGLAVVFVPLSVITRVTSIEMSGGRGALRLADVDTLFLDATAIVILALLWRRRRSIGDRLPFVVFSLLLAATSAMLLGYVVTNYGTLWRLRSIVAVPLWMLVLALSNVTVERGAHARAATARAGAW